MYISVEFVAKVFLAGYGPTLDKMISNGRSWWNVVLWARLKSEKKISNTRSLCNVVYQIDKKISNSRCTGAWHVCILGMIGIDVMRFCHELCMGRTEAGQEYVFNIAVIGVLKLGMDMSHVVVIGVM